MRRRPGADHRIVLDKPSEPGDEAIGKLESPVAPSPAEHLLGRRRIPSPLSSLSTGGFRLAESGKDDSFKSWPDAALFPETEGGSDQPPPKPSEALPQGGAERSGKRGRAGEEARGLRAEPTFSGSSRDKRRPPGGRLSRKEC